MEKLIGKVRKILDSLVKGGWQDLFLLHGLDIGGSDIEAQLLKELIINRSQPGVEDFSFDGRRGIEPGRPAESFLFHMLASPQVVSYVSKEGFVVQLTTFPTFEDICIVENLVYGIVPPSIYELRAKAGNAPLALVVFSSEYRNAVNTVHQRHADKCFSRVGISRVGNSELEYAADTRGFTPKNISDKYRINVIPAYYSVYISVQLQGDKEKFGPLRYKESVNRADGIVSQPEQRGDTERNFWVPIHKVFAGSECLRGYDLTLHLEACHLNEKLRRVHRALSGHHHEIGYNTGKSEPALSEYPFVITEGIAQLKTFRNASEGLVVPIPHETLVESVLDNNKNLITYTVPAGKKPFKSSVNIEAKGNGARIAPEYVHARHKVEAGKVVDLNNSPDMLKQIEHGGYEAVHYIDFTGDGFVNANCPEIALEIPNSLPAYSMVSAVDYFPYVKQFDLIQWWEQSMPFDLYDSIWPSNPGPPLSLCDIRYPANLSLSYDKMGLKDRTEGSIFASSDDTMTCIVGLLDSCNGKLTKTDRPSYKRVSTLPDGASGVFAPGWDSSIDRTIEHDLNDDGRVILPGNTFFNNYGLGSPFPEDSMLCAALSSFWPAAAPDITRSFAPGTYATTTPLTDDVIGMEGKESWNQIPSPQVLCENKGIAEFHKITYGDFVQTTLQNKFDYSQILDIEDREYAARTLVTALTYKYLGAITREEKIKWVIFSFKKVEDYDLSLLFKDEVQKLDLSFNKDYFYRIEIYNHKAYDVDELKLIMPDLTIKHDKAYVKLFNKNIIYASPKSIISYNAKDGWRQRKF